MWWDPMLGRHNMLSSPVTSYSKAFCPLLTNLQLRNFHTYKQTSGTWKWLVCKVSVKIIWRFVSSLWGQCSRSSLRWRATIWVPEAGICFPPLDNTALSRVLAPAGYATGKDGGSLVHPGSFSLCGGETASFPPQKLKVGLPVSEVERNCPPLHRLEDPQHTGIVCVPQKVRGWLHTCLLPSEERERSPLLKKWEANLSLFEGEKKHFLFVSTRNPPLWVQS